MDLDLLFVGILFVLHIWDMKRENSQTEYSKQ